MAFVGEIALCLSSLYIPEGWYELNGGTIPESSPLAELLGTTTLPDWSDRVPAQRGNVIDYGEEIGNDEVTLQIANLPPHGHPQKAGSIPWYYSGGTGGYGIGSSAFVEKSPESQVVTDSIGSGTAFSIIQPSVGACYIIYGGQVTLSMEESLAIIAANSAKEAIIELNGVRILSTTAVVDF